MSVLQFVTFVLGNEEYGLPITQVHEIIFVPPLTAVSNSLPSVAGIINVRDMIIPVIDMKIPFRKPQSPATRKQRIIVAETESQKIGLLVDEVREVLRVEETRLSAPPETVVTRETAYIRHLCKLEHRLIVVLEMDKLLDRLTIEHIKEQI